MPSRRPSPRPLAEPRAARAGTRRRLGLRGATGGGPWRRHASSLLAALVLTGSAGRLPGQERFDVLVAGGGAAGVCAGIAAARTGARTVILEESPWLGGQLTSAGVSATDGNPPPFETGLFREFAERVRAHYGGPAATATGWVSRLAFEPAVGAGILRSMTAAEPTLTLRFGERVERVLRDGRRVLGVVAAPVRGDGPALEYRAAVTIDATEYGDVIVKGGVPYRIGRESRGETGEPGAPAKADLMLQDFTWCAILKEYPAGAHRPVPAPPGYEAADFACAVGCVDPGRHTHRIYDWNRFITYRRLPRGKFILNWGLCGNDWHADTAIPLLETAAREGVFRAAKDLTLGLVHWIQTGLGHPELGLADDEFDTEDYLPWLPYVRESVRLRGVVTLGERDILDPLGDPERPLWRDSVAVGEYMLIDHHHRARIPDEDPSVVDETFPRPPPYGIPYGALVPESVDGLLATEKNISVTHVANGVTRLHPPCMLAGQAAGVAAAIAAAKGIEPRRVPVRDIQAVLLENRSMLFPFRDVPDDHPAFGAIQRLALAEVFRGYADPREPGRIFRPEAFAGGTSRIPLVRAHLALLLDAVADPFRRGPGTVR